MLWQRALTVAVVLPAFLAALFLLPAFWWSVFVLALVLMAAIEWGRLVPLGDRGVVAYCLAIGGGCLFVQAGPIAWLWDATIVAGCLFWAIGAPLVLASPGRSLGRLPVAAAGLVILIAAFLALVELRADAGRLLALLAVVWVADTAAYLVGRRYGRHRLAPTVSPGKTWEGVAGAAAGVVVYFLLLWVVWAPSWLRGSLLPDALLVGTLTVLGIVGDLIESWLKRRAGVKDSGTLLPGHGGVLDRVDALLAILPVAALFAAHAR